MDLSVTITGMCLNPRSSKTFILFSKPGIGVSVWIDHLMDFGIFGEIGHEISGDFCYWLEIRNRKWWVSIGDVTNFAKKLWRTIFGGSTGALFDKAAPFIYLAFNMV